MKKNKEETSSSNKAIKLLQQRVPILGWIRHYTKEDAISDVVAGITISLTMIPQSIAYAALANLSPKTGLNSAFMGCFIYVFFGTIKEVVIGPTSLMAFLTYEYTRDLNLDFVIFLCFLTGVVELLMAILRLGFLVEFISTPVVSGFTTATALIILTSQIKGILGVRFKSKGFVDTIKHLVEKGHGVRSSDVILGLSTIVALLLLRKLKDIKVTDETIGGKVLGKVLWFLSIGRNAIAVLFTTLISYYYEHNGQEQPFLITREVEEGLPDFKFPPTSTSIMINSTHTQHYEFLDMVQELGGAIVVLPIVSVLASVAIGKAYADRSLDGTQEMMTLALCNIFGSFVQSMPTCGAFTRSAVISASGVRTPLAGLYSAGLTLLALRYLAAHFHLIPRATLSAVLMSAVVFLIDYKIFIPLWKSCKRDFTVLILTLVSCLMFGVEIGLLFGAILGIGHLSYLWSRPKMEQNHCEKGNVSYVVVTPKLGLFYPAMSFLHTQLLRISEEFKTAPLVLNCVNFTDIDYTAVKSLHTLSKMLSKNGHRLLFINVSQTFIHIWNNSKCGHLDLLSSQDLEQQIEGLTATKEETEIESATLSIIRESDIKLNSHETIDLLKKEKDIQ